MMFDNIAELREYRNQLLAESDPWLLKDFPLPVPFENIETTILAYRTDLRELPNNINGGWPAEVEFPTKPF